MSITRRQQDVLREIKRFQAIHGHSPSQKEIARELGISQPTVAVHLRNLQAKRIIRKGREWGSIELTG